MSFKSSELLNLPQFCLNAFFCSGTPILQRNCKSHSVPETDFEDLYILITYVVSQLASQEITSFIIMQPSACAIKSTITKDKVPRYAYISLN